MKRLLLFPVAVILSLLACIGEYADDLYWRLYHWVNE